MSAIADLVSYLLSTGIPPDVTARIVDLAQQHAQESAEFHRTSTGIPVDTAAERRRAYDRERKRNSRKSAYKELPPPTDSQSTKEEIVSRRVPSVGARIPPDWFPSQNDLNFAETAIGGARTTSELSKFKDYWQARAGPNARKADWSATWRNWIRKAAEGLKVNGKRTIMEACDDLLDRVRAFDEPAPSDLRDGTGQAIIGLIPKG